MVFSKQKLIIAAIAVLTIVLLGAVVAYYGTTTSKKQSIPIKKASLEVWGVFDDADVFLPFTRSFHDQYDNLTAAYRKLTIEEYESELLNALASGKGPDVYMLNNTWIPRYLERLWPASPLTMDLKNFRDTFVDIANEDLVMDGRVYGIPLHVDTLALFYNKEQFASAGIATPPETWDDFLRAVKLLTRQDARGNIQRAGVALGTALNVNRSFDILSLLMLQQGAKMVDDKKVRATFGSPVSIDGESFFPAERALTFYTDFANPRKQVYTWNTLQHFSVDAFIAGEAAMMFNYARIIPLLESRAPYFAWGVAPMPQIVAEDAKINLGNYWVLVVSSTSKNPEEAWRFLTYVVDRDNAALYAELSGRPVARRDLVDTQRDDLKLGVFAVQSLTARSWYQIDNLAIEQIFADMIESVVRGAESASDAVGKAARQVTALMRK